MEEPKLEDYRVKQVPEVEEGVAPASNRPEDTGEQNPDEITPFFKTPDQDEPKLDIESDEEDSESQKSIEFEIPPRQKKEPFRMQPFSRPGDSNSPPGSMRQDADNPASYQPVRTDTQKNIMANDPEKEKERIVRLKQLSYKLNTPSGVSDLEKEPAYKRRNVKLDKTPHSSESQVSRYTLSNDEEEENKTQIKPNNPFLHDNVD